MGVWLAGIDGDLEHRCWVQRTFFERGGVPSLDRHRLVLMVEGSLMFAPESRSLEKLRSLRNGSLGSLPHDR